MLHKGDAYERFSTTTFDLCKTSPNFFIEFSGLKIHEMILNGTKIYSNDNNNTYLRSFFKLPQDLLIIGTNILQIKFSNPYLKGILGLYSTTDKDCQYIMHIKIS